MRNKTFWIIDTFMVIVSLLIAGCATVPKKTMEPPVSDVYSDTYNSLMEQIKVGQEVLRDMPKLKGFDYGGSKYLSPKYIDPYKSLLYMGGEIRLLQPARSVKISKNYVSDKTDRQIPWQTHPNLPSKGYTLSNDPKDNVWWRSNTKGYEIIMYGTYSNPHDIMSQFNPERVQLIFSDKDGNKVILGAGKLTVEEFLNFDFSEESIRKYFGEGIKKTN